jgi:hypothetical protein
LKIIFNDATELTIQSADLQDNGGLLIKTISDTEENLKTMFQDQMKTKKMVVKERESTIAEYENYTNQDAIVKYTAGILGVVMYKVGQTPTELMEALKKENQRLAEENKELSATVDTILTDILPALENVK